MNTNQISDLEARISNIEQLDIDTIVSDTFSDKWLFRSDHASDFGLMGAT